MTTSGYLVGCNHLEKMSGTTNIFFIYSQADRALLVQLLNHLQPFTKTRGISLWYDDPIEPDREWYPQIVSRFEEADMYIPLVSNAFMHSRFVQQIEFKQLVDRYREKQALLIPIILDECPWDVDFESDEYTFSFSQLHVLPEAGKHVKGWNTPEQAIQLSTEYIKRKIGLKTKGNSGLGEQLERKEVEPANTKPKASVATSQVGKEAVQKDIKTAPKTESKEQHHQKQQQEATPVAAAKDPKPTRVKGPEVLPKERKVEPIREDTPQGSDAISASQRTTTRDQDHDTGHSRSRKKTVIGLGVLVLLILAGVLLSQVGKEASKDAPMRTEGTAGSTDSENETEAEGASETTSTSVTDTSSANPTVGEPYEDGIVFEVSSDGQSGLIAHQNDWGPMIWNEAMKIHEQLGAGWRLPTHEELQKMYARIGQGADNSGEFADELYWSSTPFDENQAKMVQFSNGNATYHYNSRGTHRLFLVRAVRDFQLE